MCKYFDERALRKAAHEYFIIRISPRREFMLQELDLKQVEHISESNTLMKEEVKEIYRMMAEGKERIKCKLKIYRNGSEVLVVYKYDQTLNRYCIYHTVQLY